MIFYNTRRKIKRTILENYWFYKTLFIALFTQENKKKIYLEIDEISLNRYLFNFIKYFTLNNYTVYLSENKKVISTLNQSRGEYVYGSWILKEQIKIGKPKKPDIVISKAQLSNNYFGKTEGDAFHVPIGQYPGIYRHKIHDRQEPVEYRKKSVFMSGNMDSSHYRRISEAGFFQIPSRSEVADFIKGQSYYYEIGNLNALRDFITGGVDKKLILIDTSKQFRIPLRELKKIYQKFDFYLALPGVIIPQSHNLIEAMSVGSIPIIHKTYANLMSPGLTHMENSLIYGSLEELHELILGTFKLEQNQVKVLHENVLFYYKKYLSPLAVVKNIEENDYSKIYIQAEEKSLSLLKPRN